MTKPLHGDNSTGVCKCTLSPVENCFGFYDKYVQNSRLCVFVGKCAHKVELPNWALVHGSNWYALVVLDGNFKPLK